MDSCISPIVSPVDFEHTLIRIRREVGSDRPIEGRLGIKWATLVLADPKSHWILRRRAREIVKKYEREVKRSEETRARQAAAKKERDRKRKVYLRRKRYIDKNPLFKKHEKFKGNLKQRGIENRLTRGEFYAITRRGWEIFPPPIRWALTRKDKSKPFQWDNVQIEVGYLGRPTEVFDVAANMEPLQRNTKQTPASNPTVQAKN